MAIAATAPLVRVGEWVCEAAVERLGVRVGERVGLQVGVQAGVRAPREKRGQMPCAPTPSDGMLARALLVVKVTFGGLKG